MQIIDLAQLRFERRGPEGAVFRDAAGRELAFTASGNQLERAEAVRAVAREINRPGPVWPKER